jgi:hypothetical protein
MIRYLILVSVLALFLVSVSVPFAAPCCHSWPLRAPTLASRRQNGRVWTRLGGPHLTPEETRTSERLSHADPDASRKEVHYGYGSTCAIVTGGASRVPGFKTSSK